MKPKPGNQNPGGKGKLVVSRAHQEASRIPCHVKLFNSQNIQRQSMELFSFLLLSISPLARRFNKPEIVNPATILQAATFSLHKPNYTQWQVVYG